MEYANRRTIIKTSLCHSCFSQELNEPQPKSCRCRKYVSRSTASKLVKEGMAEWLIEFTPDGPIPTWDVVLYGRTVKTPRAHTLESSNPVRAPFSVGQIERHVMLADETIFGNPDTILESKAEWESYHDTEMEERILMFRGCGIQPAGIDSPLLRLKHESDTMGMVQAPSDCIGPVVMAAALKHAFWLRDPFDGRVLFPGIGHDSRTFYGKRK